MLLGRICCRLTHSSERSKELAKTSADSRERFEARRLLPGMAKRLREVRLFLDCCQNCPCTVCLCRQATPAASTKPFIAHHAY